MPIVTRYQTGILVVPVSVVEDMNVIIGLRTTFVTSNVWNMKFFVLGGVTPSMFPIK